MKQLIKQVSLFILKAIVYVAIFVFMTKQLFPGMYKEPVITIDNPRYEDYYDDSEIPPCDTTCVKQMIEDTLEEWGYVKSHRTS